MSLPRLPAEMQGDWIWVNADQNSVENYAFFRKEFVLEEVPTAADFWITANTHYHVYINGRHFCRGPAPAAANTACISHFEAAYCLQYGRNVVAVLVHNVDISRYGNNRKKSALWCQMNVDGNPTVLTDASWSARPGDCYLANQPRVSSTDGFVEAVDMRLYPDGWNMLDYNGDGAWESAKVLSPISDGRYQFTTAPDTERVSEAYSFLNLVIHGTAERNRATSNVSYPRAPVSPGVYAAETYIHSGQDAEGLAFQMLTDDPCCLYVNHKLVFSQGVREMQNFIDPDWNAPRCYAQEELADISGRMDIKKGTNHVTIVQQVGTNSSGATLIFPEVEEGGFKFARGKDAISMPGWTITGPLNLPFSHVSDPLNLGFKPSEAYFNKESLDVAAGLIAHTFTVAESEPEGIPIDEVELEQGQYMVLELERYVRGCPQIELEGSAGDLIDVVYGDSLDGDLVNPIKEGVRKVYTITLSDTASTWQAVAPHGMRYLMVFCRHCSHSVTMRDVCVRRQVANHRDPASFVCSDELFNQIWEVGLNTLEATHDSVFLNAGGHQECQFLTDAMLQSFASFHLFGSYEYSEKALREFAAAQYENGEMPALVPGDFAIKLLDSMMLWPVWLQRHVEHSGDMDLLKEMLPHLERLLIYLEAEAGEESVLLGNRTPPYDNPCIVDYDGLLDRRGISTALNALYVLCLLRSEWLFRLAKHNDFAKYCNRLAAEIVKEIRDLTWNEEKGLFADGWYDKKMSEHCSMQANVLALMCGMVQEDEFDKIFNALFVEYAPFHNLEIDQENDNPFFKYFIMEMAFSLGRKDWATDYMRYYWGGMIQRGATTWWEKFSPDLADQDRLPISLCNGYGVAASYFLVSEMIGIRPAEPGYKQVYFAPSLTALETATASIPTPNGAIKLDWRFNDMGVLEMSIDANYPLEVVIQVDKALAANATMKIGENVAILK